MRLGLNLGYWGAKFRDPTELVQEAERLGFDSVWTAEAYGSDAVTPLTWLAARTERIKLGTAILQMPARTPAMTAMTAMSLDLLSGGRLLLGLGASGPQVAEGWHGVAYGKPLARSREYIEIVRTALRRDKPLEYDGQYYRIPVREGTGLGKPLKLITHPLRSDVPIYLGAIGPKNVALAAEVADGWLPMFFSPERMGMYREWLQKGFARAHKEKTNFDIAPTVAVQMGDDVAACRNAVKPQLALYIGGMGARERNFYYNLACRYGYEEAAGKIQTLFMKGKREEAAAAVPDRLVDEVALCGPKSRIGERLSLWKESGVTTLLCATPSKTTLRTMAELVLR